MTVDIHAHILVKEILAGSGPEPWRPAIVPAGDTGYLVKGRNFTNGPAFRAIVEPERITAAMQAAKVDLAVLSTPPYAFFYDLPAAEGERANVVQNDGLARAVGSDPRHLAGLGSLPLQDVALAVRELHRIMSELGLSGVEIGSNVNGEDPGSDTYLPFWEAAEDLGAIVFVHPSYFCQLGSDRMADYYLRNLLGNPMETALFAAHLIFSGILERFPELKVVLAHAGGALPCLLGRLEHGYQARAEPKLRISKPPSAFLGNFYFDTITHSATSLEFVIKLAGADHVLLGSDYPYDMGYECPVDIVDQLTGLSPADRERILSGNALRLLGRAP